MQPQYTLASSSEEIPYGYCHCGCGQKTPIATRNFKQRNVVKGQPIAYILGHNQRKPTLAAAFWQHCPQRSEDECWEWTGTITPDGYGLLGHNYGKYLAHRVSWEVNIGTLADDVCVLHRCDNPPCVIRMAILATFADAILRLLTAGGRCSGSPDAGRSSVSAWICARSAAATFDDDALLLIEGDAGTLLAAIRGDGMQPFRRLRRQVAKAGLFCLST